jgi:hypothetical protein
LAGKKLLCKRVNLLCKWTQRDPVFFHMARPWCLQKTTGKSRQPQMLRSHSSSIFN